MKITINASKKSQNDAFEIIQKISTRLYLKKISLKKDLFIV